MRKGVHKYGIVSLGSYPPPSHPRAHAGGAERGLDRVDVRDEVVVLGEGENAGLVRRDRGRKGEDARLALVLLSLLLSLLLLLLLAAVVLGSLVLAVALADGEVVLWWGGVA